MSNMGYCRFQNTLPDLRDCFEALNDISGNIETLSSEEETRSAKRLISLCHEIADEFPLEDAQ